MSTFSGRRFDYVHPTVEMIDIQDIARALSHECRFAGHVLEFYSVAQHSVECSFLVPQAFALEALLHDAAEAYCKDIPTPLKTALPDYKKIESNVDRVIRERFGLPMIESDEVKKADLIMLATEKRSFNKDNGKNWAILDGIDAINISLKPLAANVAYRLFLTRYKTLTGECHVIH